MKSGVLFIVLMLAIIGCRKKVDVSHVKVDIEVVPFYDDLFSIPPDSVAKNLPELKQKYGVFLDAYSAGVIHVGFSDEPEYADHLKSFLEYGPNVEVYDECKKQFNDTKTLKKELDNAFRHYLHYYPEAQIPIVYLHISGFNQSIVVDSALVSISVEKYLGMECKFYELLAFPKYLRKKMIPEKIVPDVMKATAFTEFPYNDSVNDVVNHLIYQGKILHFVKHMTPEIHDTLLFDFSEQELKWCRNHEDDMWSAMVERKYVFNTDFMMIQKMVGDAPFTSYFGQDSPGRAAHFIGYRIVEAFLKQNPLVKLPELMKMNDGHIILSQSGYRP
jgi:hypothetical protein